MAVPVLHVSDLDHTLLGDEAALARFAAWVRRNRPRLRLAYASGRLYDSVRESIRTTALPGPDAIIAGVGTEIRILPTGTLDQRWRARLRHGWQPAAVRAVLRRLPGAASQPAEFQSDLKISYYLPAARPTALAEIAARLRRAGVAARIVYSSDRDLDILPAAAGKGAAARYLARRWGIPLRRVLVSGDSLNDRSLFEQGFCGIVVANACAELRALRGTRVYQARQPFAAGVLEGLTHWTSGGAGWT